MCSTVPPVTERLTIAQMTACLRGMGFVCSKSKVYRLVTDGVVSPEFPECSTAKFSYRNAEEVAAVFTAHEAN